MSNVIPRQPGMTFEQRERAICMLTAGMSTRDVPQYFKRHKSTMSRLLNRFQQTGNMADRPRSGRPCKTMPREPVFSRLHLNAIDSSRKLGCLLRNATGTRVCDRIVWNRLDATRLETLRP